MELTVELLSKLKDKYTEEFVEKMDSYQKIGNPHIILEKIQNASYLEGNMAMLSFLIGLLNEEERAVKRLNLYLLMED